MITDFPDPSLVRNLEENVKLSVDGVQGAAKTTALVRSSDFGAIAGR